MFPDFSRRSERSEWMDDPAVKRQQLEDTFAHLARINALLGGHATSINGIEALIEPDRKAMSVLDVGTGGGDFPRTLTRWADHRGIDVYVMGVDLSSVAINHARGSSRVYRNIEYRRRDVLELSPRERFDVVHASLMLHHLSDQEAVEALSKMYEVSTLGVVINDLHRHPAGYVASRLILPLLSRNPMIRHDGPLSVLRGFQRRELRRLMEAAGLPRPQIRWRPFFRWQCVIRKEAA